MTTKTAMKSKDSSTEEEKSLLSVDELKDHGAAEVKAGKDRQRLLAAGWLPFVENAEHNLIVPVEINQETVKGCVAQDPGHCVFAEQFKKVPGVKEAVVLRGRTFLMFEGGRQIKYVNPDKMSAAIINFDNTGSVGDFQSGDYCLRPPKEHQKTGTGKAHGLTARRTMVIVAPDGTRWSEVFTAKGHWQAFNDAEVKYPKSEGYSVVKHRQKSPRGVFLIWYKEKSYRFDPYVDSLTVDNPANATSVHAAAEALAREKFRKDIPKGRYRVEVVPRKGHVR